MLDSPDPLLGPGLYVHLPYCRSRCGYCDFFTAVAPPRQRRAFLEDLVAEARLLREGGICARSGEGPGDDLHGFDGPFRTMFLGGGTPSLLSGARMAHLLERIRSIFPLDAGAEVTIECNPESLTPGRIRAYRSAGVNRVSLGVQSADDAELRLLDRAHTFADVRRRIRQLRREGFGSLSVDLIYGLPGSTLESWRGTLGRVLALEVEHISAYLLTLEPHVPLARRLAQGAPASALAPLPAEEGARAQYEALREALAGAGYRQYEISNFARPGHESRHNQNYWARGDYLGLGPSAHSHRAGRRWANHASMSRYRRDVREGRLPWATEERIEGAAEAAEWIFLGLRRMEGVAWNVLAAAAGSERLPALEERVVRLERGGFLQRRDGRLRLQPEACFVSNAVFRELLEVF